MHRWFRRYSTRYPQGKVKKSNNIHHFTKLRHRLRPDFYGKLLSKKQSEQTSSYLWNFVCWAIFNKENNTFLDSSQRSLKLHLPFLQSLVYLSPSHLAFTKRRSQDSNARFLLAETFPSFSVSSNQNRAFDDVMLFMLTVLKDSIMESAEFIPQKP